MALSREITAQIKDLLAKNEQGLSITEIVKATGINRNTAGRYLDSMLVSGQVEMRHFGMAKIYSLSERMPVSSALSLTSEFVMQFDAGLRIIYLNAPFENLLGLTSADLLGKNIEYTPIPQMFDTAFQPVLTRLRQGVSGVEYHGEISIPALGRIFSCRVVPIVNTEGKKGVSVILEDITERKQDEERLRRSETRYRVLAEASRDLIFVIGHDDRIEYVNSFAASFVGRRPDELVGMRRSEVFPDRTNKRQKEMLARVFSTGLAGRSEGPLYRNNTSRWFDHFLLPLIDQDGTVRSALGISRDITERKLAEEELFNSRQMLQLVLDTVPVRVFWKDRNSVFLGCNQSLADDAGYESPADLLGKTDFDHASAARAEYFRADDREVMKTGVPKLDYEELQIRPDGSQAWLLTSKVPLRNKDGEIIGILGTYDDITERKRSLERLRESEARFRTLFNSTSDLTLVHSLKPDGESGNYVEVNDVACTCLKYSRDELLRMSPRDLVAPESLEAAVRSNRTLLAEGRVTAELVLQTKDRQKIPVDITSYLLEFQGQTLVMAIIRDSTGRIRADSALRVSEARYRTVFENTGTATTVIEENMVISLANAEFERLSGYAKEEIVGKKRWTEFVVSEDLEKMTAQHTLRRRNRQEALDHYEFRFRRRNGDIRDILLTVDMIPGTSQSIASLLDITDRKRSESELLLREERYGFIVNNSLDIITRQTPACICTYVSPSVTRVLGYPVSEAIGLPLLSLIHPDDIARVQKDLHAILGSGVQEVTSVFRYRHKDGRYIPFENTTNVIRDEVSGEIREFLSISRDISARIASEEAIRKRDRLVHAFAEASGYLLTGKVLDPFPRLLSTMGEALGIDAACICQEVRNVPGDPLHPKIAYRWTRNTSHTSGKIQDFVKQLPPAWSERLARGEWIAGPLDKGGPLRQEYPEIPGACSVLIVPVHIRGVYWGFLGCWDLQNERGWGEAEIEILMTLAATIGLVLEKGRENYTETS